MLRHIFLLALLGIFNNSLGQKNEKIPLRISQKQEIIESQNHNCIRNRKLLLKARLVKYPFNIANKIQIASFKNEEFLDSIPRLNGSICYSRLQEIQTLTKSQVARLTDILYNYGFKGQISVLSSLSCYYPRNVILFLDKSGTPFEFIEVSFDCKQKKCSSKKIDFGEECEQKYDLLKSFFKDNKVTYGTVRESK